MDEERQTGNTGRPSAKTESKSEGKSAHAEKLKTEKSSSAATKSKFGKGGKKGEKAKDAAGTVADRYGFSKNKLYNFYLKKDK